MNCYQHRERGEPECTSYEQCIWGCALWDHHEQLRRQRAGHTHELPALKSCTHCGAPAMGWFWSKDQGYVGWCREHVNRQTIEVNEESFR